MRVGQVSERDQSGRMADDNLGFFERDDSQEQPDTGRHGEFQVLRNCIDDILPNPEHGNQEEQHARAEHRREPLLPSVFECQHHGEREEGVDAHSRRKRDRVVGVKRHDESAHRGGDAGGDKDRTRIHPRLAEDDGVDEHDVDHR